MDTTLFLSRLVGPVLIVRGLTLIIYREHFRQMMNNLEQEMRTISFAMVPVGIMLGGLAILQLHDDTSSVAAILFHLIGWGAVVKTTLLMLFPKRISAKVQILGRWGFLTVAWVVTSAVGVYFTWFGYF